MDLFRYSETVREHRHEHLEDLKRDDEQTHEHHETTRENERDSRSIISTRKTYNLDITKSVLILLVLMLSILVTKLI